MASTGSDADFEDRVRRVMEKVEPLIRESLSHDVRPLHEIEIDVDQVGDIIKEVITKEVVEQAGDGYCSTRALCKCGSMAAFCARRRRQLVTLHGRLNFVRAYYYCETCRRGGCPTDVKLDLGPGDCSRVVKAFAARVASYLPFDVAAGELRALRRIDISTTTVQRLAKSVGNRIGAEWDSIKEQVAAGQASTSVLQTDRLYMAADAAKCHVGGEWRDVKLGAAYHRNANGLISFAEYYASLERSTEFGWRLPALAYVAGGVDCDDRQMLGDGADWIWKEAARHQPSAVQTLDFYHATEHLQQLANVRFGERSAAAYAWIDAQKERLLNDGHALVLEDIAAWRPRTSVQAEQQRTTTNYLSKHRGRMNYKLLRERGYDIGSGLIESGCKTVVKNRMGAAGMRWEEPGATAILNLSAFWRSDRSNNYLQYT